MEKVREELLTLDPTLAGASSTVASKISYQIDRLSQRATHAELLRNEIINRHAESLSQALYPNGGLQERGVAGVYYVAHHGIDLLKVLHDSIHTDCLDHQILEL